jgi:hypothetical protein
MSKAYGYDIRIKTRKNRKLNRSFILPDCFKTIANEIRVVSKYAAV